MLTLVLAKIKYIKLLLITYNTITTDICGHFGHRAGVIKLRHEGDFYAHGTSPVGLTVQLLIANVRWLNEFKTYFQIRACRINVCIFI